MVMGWMTGMVSGHKETGPIVVKDSLLKQVEKLSMVTR